MPPTPPRSPLVIAHRATRGHALENTLRGLRAGLALGVDGIEVDVRATADGVVVLLHDPTVDRTTNGAGAAAELSYAALRALDAGEGERIPTLDEALDVIGAHAELIIELKGDGLPEGIDLAAEVVRIVRRRGSERQVRLWSFDAALLERLTAAGRDLRVSHLCVEPSAEVIERTQRLELEGVSVQCRQATAEFVESIRALGWTVFAWTANEPEEIARLARLPLTGIVSDYPERVRAALASRRAEADG